MSKPQTWSELDLTEAQLLYRKLRETFNTQLFAEESARTVTRICDQALVTIPDEYCQEMFCEVERYAQKVLQTGRRRPATLRIVLDAIQHRLGSMQVPLRTGRRAARTEANLAKS